MLKSKFAVVAILFVFVTQTTHAQAPTPLQKAQADVTKLESQIKEALDQQKDPLKSLLAAEKAAKDDYSEPTKGKLKAYTDALDAYSKAQNDKDAKFRELQLATLAKDAARDKWQDAKKDLDDHQRKVEGMQVALVLKSYAVIVAMQDEAKVADATTKKDLLTAVADAKKRVDTLEQALPTHLTTALKPVKDQIGQVDTDVKAVGTKVGEVEKKVDMALKGLNDFAIATHQQFQMTQGQINGVSQQVTDVDKKVDQTNKKLVDIEKKLDTVLLEIAAVKKTVGDLNTQVNNLNVRTEADAKKIVQLLNVELKKAEALKASAEAKATETEKTLAAYEKELECMKMKEQCLQEVMKTYNRPSVVYNYTVNPTVYVQPPQHFTYYRVYCSNGSYIYNSY